MSVKLSALIMTWVHGEEEQEEEEEEEEEEEATCLGNIYVPLNS